MSPPLRACFVPLAACLVVASSHIARAQTGALPHHEQPLVIDSGLISVPGPDRATSPSLLFSTEVRAPGAAWLRLWFADTLLPGDPAADGAFLRLTSLLDGATQHLDAQSLAWWSNSSAYFNGEAVRLELFAFPATGHARVAIRRVTVGEFPTYTDRSICGTLDDRALSSDPRTGREIVVGVNSPCTAWLIDDANRTLLSAGHCAPAPPSVIQFNCPLSDANGVAQHPPPADQYPIDGTSPQTVNGGVGNDFAYFGTLPNSETGRTAFQAQRATFRLATAAPTSTTGRTIRITGYGSTSTGVSRTWNFAQKTHVGPYVSLSGTTVRYATDTTGGNSGSAVEDLLSGLAIGVHTHAGCTSTGGSNQGTAIQLPALQSALANPRGVCLSGRAAPAPNPSIFLAGDLNNTAGSINTSTGAYSTTVGQDAGLVRLQGLAVDPFGSRLFAIADQRLIYPLGRPVQTSWPITGTTQTLSALAFDARTRTLYALAQASGQLFRLSPTGEATPIGTPRGGRVGAIEFDHARGVLFALDDTTSGTGTRLIRINTSDGSHTLVGPLGAGITDCNGLASNGDLFTVEAVNRNLYRINPDTGAATLVGPTRAMLGASFGMGGFDPTPRCFADLDADAGVSVDDLLLYLETFSQGHPAADIDDGSRSGIMDGGVTIDDLLWYLARFEEGC